MRTNVIILVVLLLFAISSTSHFALADDQSDVFNQTVSSSANTVSITVDNNLLIDEYLNSLSNAPTEFDMSGYGQTYEHGRPNLPMYSKFIIVPPQAEVELRITSTNISEARTANQPDLCSDQQLTAQTVYTAKDNYYPESWGQISDPLIIRGVKLVKVTLYPIRYNQHTKKFLYAENLEAKLLFSEGSPRNPVLQPRGEIASPEFQKFINNFAENGDAITLDALWEAQNPGHYLIVTHESCLQHIARFIEWRRMTGYRMDILSIADDISGNTNQIKALIQERYDDFLEQGLEPFDQLLLVGDRSSYLYHAASDWKLESPRGETIWGGIQHADYKYALLEGDDDYPDVGFSRWCAGDQDMLELFVGRTMAYEAEPYMDDTDWFTRGAVYSQHWGNDPINAWHQSIHTNVRWARRMLKNRNYNDVRFFEDYDYDQWGSEIGPFVKDQFNEGVNLMLGRAENLFWNQNFNGVEDNVVFPLRLVLSGHGEYTVWSMLRTGDGEHLKGPVVATCNWGGPPTITTTAAWLELVKAVVVDELSFGWGRVNAITKVETYFPDFEFGNGWNAYSHIKTDNDYYGDPGLKPWTGVPRMVDVEFPESISQNATYVEVVVNDQDTGEAVEGAVVTIYDPSAMPDFDSAEYADYAGMVTTTQLTDANGIARIIIGDSFDLQDENSISLTVHGKLIRPAFEEIEISTPNFSVDIADFEISAGDDNEVNQGEDFDIFITAVNNGNADLDNLIAVSSSNSDYLIIMNDTIAIGNIASGEQLRSDNAFRFRASTNLPDGEAQPATRPLITVRFYNDNGSSNGAILLDPLAPNLEIYEIGDRGIIPVDAEEYELDIELINKGRASFTALGARLISTDMWVSVNRDNSGYPDIDVGERETLDGEVFTLTVNPKAIPGMLAKMELLILHAFDRITTIPITIQLGEESENAPQGPDNYGMICLDDTDSDWDYAPEYDWIEISLEDRDRDFNGILIEEFDGESLHEIGEAVAIPLPFQIGFYGQVYDTISVCTNGFICPGNQSEITNFQNWRLDEGFGGGAGMIAPFWDWLRFTDNSGVYYYYDDEEHLFIIEWSELRQRPNEDIDQTFQVILYDRAYFAREGDNTDILMQYKTVSNQAGANDVNENIAYASVGISSPDGKSGINYTFLGDYPVTSAPLENQRAIRFTSSLREHTGEVFGTVTTVEDGAAIAGAVVTAHGLRAVTDEAGQYSISNVVIGAAFDVIGNHEIYDDSTYSSNIIQGEDPLEVNLVLHRTLDVPEIDDPQLPHSLQIHAVYPNPFNSFFSVKFSGVYGKRSVLSVYSLNGQLVQQVDLPANRSGVQTVSVDAHDMATGMYLVRLESGGVSRAVKVVNIR